MDTATTQQVWIYIGEGDSRHGQSLTQWVLDALRAAGCPGATVLRGIGGYGVNGMMRTDLIVDAPGQLPVIITFIDRTDRVELVLPTLRELVTEGMIAVSPIQVIQHSYREGGPFPRHLTVADVMSRDVARVGPDAPVSEIVSLLIDRALRALPVVDDELRVIGIITDGDLLTRGGTTLPLRLQKLFPLDERAAQVAALAQQPQRAADVMTIDPVILTMTTSLAHAAEVMAKHNMKRIPVVNATGKLVGMVSRYDLLKTVTEGLRQRPEQQLRRSNGELSTVGSLSIAPIPVVRETTSLAETLDQLLATRKRRIVVVNYNKQVIGIITDGDVLRRATRPVPGSALQRLAMLLSGGNRPEGLELDLKGRTAADVMTSPVITVTTDTPTTEAIQLMISYKIKRLPVIDQQGHVVGIIGRADVLRALEQDQHEAE